MTESHVPEPNDDELDVDDDALELAAGGILLMNSPTQTPPQYTGKTPNYSYNSTIYFQVTNPGSVT
ncbi:MAG TPA: hypothetical protein VK139_04815 [Microbacteriaceae bacterium]|nr:hypothetical protein [Microbacteriaceae bacterium]